MERAARDTPAPGGDSGQQHTEMTGGAHDPSRPDAEDQPVPGSKKPGFFQRFITKYDLSAPTLMMMFK